jgi:hypothetical protein
MSAIETLEFENGYKIEIHQDEDSQNPRHDWDHLCTMAFSHRRYNLGDKDHGYDSSDYNSWQEMEADIYKNEKPVICLQVSMYDHSGITIFLGEPTCRWDSGQIGFIYVSREKALKEFNTKRITKKIKEKILEIAKLEIQEYDSYLTGEVYGYIVYDDKGDEVHSCWGFIGDIKYCVDEAKHCVPDTYEKQLALI